MTKQMPGWMLRDHANLADAYKQHIHDGGESALGDFLRDEAARREDEGMKLRDIAPNETVRAAIDKMASDGVVFVSDAPPPPAPDDFAKLAFAAEKAAQRQVQPDGRIFEIVTPEHHALMAAIEALRTQRDALKALFLPIAEDCAKELKLGTMEVLLSCPDDMTKTDSGAHRLAHLVAQWDAEKKRAEAAEAALAMARERAARATENHERLVKRVFAITDKMPNREEWRAMDCVERVEDSLKAAEADAKRLRDKAENVVIAHGMGWDMDGVIDALQNALAQGGNDDQGK